MSYEVMEIQHSKRKNIAEKLRNINLKQKKK